MFVDGKPDYAMLRELFATRQRVDPSSPRWLYVTTREQAELNEALFQAAFEAGWDAALSMEANHT